MFGFGKERGPVLHCSECGGRMAHHVAGRCPSSVWDVPAEKLRAKQAAPAHEDDLAVDRFGAVMKAKLAKKRNDGRGGWSGPECSEETLSRMLRDHVAKGDPVDVANFAMMLHQRGERIAQAAPAPSDGLREVLADALDLLKSFGLNDSVAYRNGIAALTSSPAQEGETKAVDGTSGEA